MSDERLTPPDETDSNRETGSTDKNQAPRETGSTHEAESQNDIVAPPTSEPQRAPEGHVTGLPAEVFALAEPAGRRPGGRSPRRGDLVLTVILTIVLYLLAFRYVQDAIGRGQEADALLDGAQLATILAIVAPIVLAVFSTVFSIVFLRRRVLAFWLPVIAGILVVALYAVTQQMLETAVINGVHTG